MRTPLEPIRVLIVDDSALMRKLLTDVLRGYPEVEVVGSARDGDEALAHAEKLRPDVVTLDIEMPGKTGLEILPRLVELYGASVIMVSSHTQEGAEATLAALELGAVDYLAKPEKHQFSQLRERGELLLAKIRAAAYCRPRRRRPRPTSTPTPPPSTPSPSPASSTQSGEKSGERSSETPSQTSTPAPSAPPGAVIVVGISTGGPQALSEVLPELTFELPPILIVQHMPAQFTSVFAARLNRACSATVKEAEEGDKVLPGRILIAPGGRHMSVAGSAANARIVLSDGPPVNGHRPSIDVLFNSAVKIYGATVVGFLMTGMGRDGVEGCKTILAAAGATYGQDEATSAVYGMNKVAQAEGAINLQFPLEALPGLIKRHSPGR